jgi:hypothetical protein
MQRYTVYLYLETALHVSGHTSTHHQECIQLYLQHLVFVTLLLLSAAIVEELELVCVCCGWRKLHNEGLFYDLFSSPNVDVKAREADSLLWACSRACGATWGLRPMAGPLAQHLYHLAVHHFSILSLVA